MFLTNSFTRPTLVFVFSLFVAHSCYAQNITPPGTVVSFDIRINGTTLEETILVESIQTSVSVDQPGQALLRIVPDDILVEPDFRTPKKMPLGANIDIRAGYDDNKLTPLFSGTIESQRLFSSDGAQAGLIFEIVCKTSSGQPGPSTDDYQLTLGVDFGEFDLSKNDSTVHGTVSLAGTAQIMPGSTVQLKDLSAVFSGSYNVAGVKHLIKNGQWKSEITLNNRAK